MVRALEALASKMVANVQETDELTPKSQEESVAHKKAGKPKPPPFRLELQSEPITTVDEAEIL